MTVPVSWADVQRAAERLHGAAHRTPVATSRSVDERIGARVFFKCENLQRTGSFKFRGAFNSVRSLGAMAQKRGVITASSGNHAQALALAGRRLDVEVTVVMPDDAPSVKLEATRGYGARIVTYDRGAGASREQLATELAERDGQIYVPPYDYEHTIAGQATATKELLEEHGPLDWLLVPCGGGGLLAGACIAAAELAPSCKVVGVEPAAGDDGVRSFRSGAIQSVDNPDTIADGARTSSLGVRNWAIIEALAHDMVAVPDGPLAAAMLYLWERLKLVVEPTGALAFAALCEQSVEPRTGERVGVLLSGGNVDVRALPGLIELAG